MRSYANQEGDGQTWRQVRRSLLAILGLLAVPLTVLIIQSALLQRTWRRIEARGGTVQAVNGPSWLAHLMGKDVRSLYSFIAATRRTKETT